MKIELQNKRVIAVIDDRSNPKFPNVTIVIDEALGGEYDNHLAFQFGKELDSRADVKVGQHVDITGYVGSRQTNGRYYTNVRGTYCKVVGGTATSGREKRGQAPPHDDDKDLPF